MRREFLLVIAAVIFLMVVFYWKDHYFGSDNMKPSISIARNEGPSSDIVVAPQESFTAASSSDLSTVSNSSSMDESHKLFVNALKELSQCLQIKNTIDYDQVEPTLDNLLTSVKPALGEMTVFTDDWAQTDVQYADGTIKRIRTEINYDNPGNPTKYLQVYKLNDQKIPEMEDIDPQQSVNPPDDYVESLKTGSNILLTEKGGRVYFPGGEEMAVIEQNGKLDSFTMTRNNKTINCSSMMSAASSCQCY